MSLRLLPAAIVRSLPLSSTCASFSASAKVEGDTSGPTAGAVPNAGGAPGGRSAAFWVAVLLHAQAVATTPIQARLRKCLRDFDMFSPNHIVAGPPTPISGAKGRGKSGC